MMASKDVLMTSLSETLKERERLSEFQGDKIDDGKSPERISEKSFQNHLSISFFGFKGLGRSKLQKTLQT